jgi:hypothetical protein
MNLFKKYFSLISESTAEDRYRKSKGLEPLEKLNPYEILEPDKDNRNIYISFRNMNKIGINPQSFHTESPNAIYTYPLKLIWKEFDHVKKKIVVQYAGEMPYIYVIRPKNPSKVLDLKKYTDLNFQNDLKKIIESGLFKKEKIDFIVDNINKKNNFSAGKKIWVLIKKLSTVNKNLKFNTWNRIFRKLDYDYVLDSGDSIIEVEPTQALFLSSADIKIVKVIDNKYHIKREDYKKGWSGVWNKDIWENGVWKDGTWFGKIWKYGFWLKGIWKNGAWKDGTWKSGTWEKGTWHDGIWEDGTWKKGTWYDGVWHNGTWESGDWYDGTWLDGTWKGGEWISGKWFGGKDKDGNYHLEGDSPDKWKIK